MRIFEIDWLTFEEANLGETGMDDKVCRTGQEIAECESVPFLER